MKVEKTCEICGATFHVIQSRASTAKTCSLKCRGELIAKGYADRRAEVKCKACGKLFYVPQCHADRRSFCSDECAAPSRKLNRAKGEGHYRWHGGVSQHHNGYRYLKAESHPFGGESFGYVFEHRLVMEEWLREVDPAHKFLVRIGDALYLSPDIAVHHINEEKQDNRRQNLLACTNAAHLDIHMGRIPMQGEIWPEREGLTPFQPRKVVCTCKTCGAEFLKKLSSVKQGSGKYCSRSCFFNRNN